MAQTGALPPVSPSSGPRVIGSAEDYRHMDFVELTAPILTMAALPMIFNDCSLADGVTGHGNISQLETWWMVKHDNCDGDDDEAEEAPRRRRRKIGFHSRCLVDLCCAFQKFGSIQDVLGRLGPRCMKKVSPKQIYQQNAAATRGSKCIHDKSVREPSGPVRDSIAWQRFFQPRVGPWFHRLRIGVWPGAPVARLHCEVMVVLVGL